MTQLGPAHRRLPGTLEGHRASKRWWCDVSTINNKISSDTWNVEAVFIEMRNYKESFMEMVCKHPNSTVTTY